MAVATRNGQQRAPAIPFRKGTRQHFDRAGLISYADLVTGRLTLPQVGLLAGVLVHVNGTMNFTMAGAH